jgi:hypothetical protein
MATTRVDLRIEVAMRVDTIDSFLPARTERSQKGLTIKLKKKQSPSPDGPT